MSKIRTISYDTTIFISSSLSFCLHAVRFLHQALMITSSVRGSTTSYTVQLVSRRGQLKITRCALIILLLMCILTTGKTGTAVQHLFAVRPQKRRTAKAKRTAHNNSDARQRNPLGKEKSQRTAKKRWTAKFYGGARQSDDARQKKNKAHGNGRAHGKEPLSCGSIGRTAKKPLPCVFPFAVRLMAFSSFTSLLHLI